MSTANEDINDADDLRRAVEEKLQDNGHAATVCRFLGLAVRGNAAQKKTKKKKKKKMMMMMMMMMISYTPPVCRQKWSRGRGPKQEEHHRGCGAGHL